MITSTIRKEINTRKFLSSGALCSLSAE